MSRERSLLILGGAIVVAIIVLLFVVRPLYETIQTDKATLSDRQTEIADLDVQLASINDLVAKYQAIDETQKASLNKRFPADANTEALVAQIEGIAISTQVIVGNVQFSDQTLSTPTTIAKGYNELGANLSVAGSYENIINFIKALETNDRIVTVDSIALAPGELGLAGTLKTHAYFAATASQKEKVNTVKTNTTEAQ